MKIIFFYFFLSLQFWVSSVRILRRDICITCLCLSPLWCQHYANRLPMKTRSKPLQKRLIYKAHAVFLKYVQQYLCRPAECISRRLTSIFLLQEWCWFWHYANLFPLHWRHDPNLSRKDCNIYLLWMELSKAIFKNSHVCQYNMFVTNFNHIC